MNLTTDRATKKAYFSDMDGGHIVDFQFTPPELDFTEGGRFSDRVMTGQYLTDYIWISGKPSKFNLKLWVDRTQESMLPLNQDQDPFADIVRFPKRTNPRFTNFDVVNLIRGIANNDTSSGFASTFRKKNTSGANQVDSTIYSGTPDFSQDKYSPERGVYDDVERLMHYVRPLGFKLGNGSIGADGSVSIKDFAQSRFTPPPMVRFFYGNLWTEGYIEEVKYSLSMMSKTLVPRRLEADISFLRTAWGYLDEVSANGEPDITV